MNLAKRRSAVIIMLFAFLLTGCANDAIDDYDINTEPPEFLYMTEVIPFPTLPEWLPNIGATIITDEQVYFTAWGNGDENTVINAHSLYVMNLDGTGLKALPNHSVEMLPDTISHGYVSITNLHIDSMGYLWTVEFGNYSVPNNVDVFNPYDDSYFNLVRKMDSDGTNLLEIDLKRFAEGDDFFYVSALCVDSSQNIYIATRSQVHVLDAQGNLLFSLSGQEHVMQLTRLPDGSVTHFSWQAGSARLQVIDVSRHGGGESIKLPAEVISVFPGNDHFDIFYNQGASLYGVHSETNEAVHVLNWVDVGVASNGVSDLIVQDDGQIIAVTRAQRWAGNEAIEIIRSIKTPYAELPERTLLTVGTLYASEILISAVMQFNRNSTTHRINIVEYSSFNITEDSTEGFTRLTTEIIAGGGPDILIMTGLPFRDYADRGVLVDLYPLIDADSILSRSDMIGNILNKDEINNSLFRIIPGFSIDTMIGDSEVLGSNPGWDMDEFINIINANPQSDIPMGYDMTNQWFLRLALTHEMYKYVDRESGTVDFDNEEFIDMLEFANTLHSEFSFNFEPIITGRQIMMNIEFGTFDNFMHYRTLFVPEAGKPREDENGEATEDSEDSIVIKGFPVDNQNGHVLVPHDSIAITTRCNDIDGAWEFIRTLLMDGFQRNFLTWYFPVNRAIFEERVSEAMDSRSVTLISYVRGYDRELNREVRPLSEEEADMIMAIIDNSMIAPEDEALWNIVNESAADFFNGRALSQDVAKIIQSRAELYISEKS